MSAYTIVNLKEVEDQAPNLGLSPEFEARFARVALEAELIGLTYQRIAPNHRIAHGHKHKTQEEMYVVVSGSVRVKLEDDIKELGPWDAVRVEKDTMRAFEAGPEGAEIIAIGAPGGPGDAIGVDDWWPEASD
jgi:mannose-6-phosphate isomerase-like protein (cupin superfamily)